MVRKYFSIRRDYGKEEWLFVTRKEQLHVLREAYKEYLKMNELPKYEPGDIVIIPYENLQGVDDENCLFGKVDYSKNDIFCQD